MTYEEICQAEPRLVALEHELIQKARRLKRLGQFDAHDFYWNQVSDSCLRNIVGVTCLTRRHDDPVRTVDARCTVDDYFRNHPQLQNSSHIPQLTFLDAGSSSELAALVNAYMHEKVCQLIDCSTAIREDWYFAKIVYYPY